MPVLEITSMSTRGQIVLPLRVRNDANLKSGTKFAVMTDGENILLKPIETPKMAVFKSLLKRSRALASSYIILLIMVNNVHACAYQAFTSARRIFQQSFGYIIHRKFTVIFYMISQYFA